MSAYEVLRDRISARIKETGLDPRADGGLVSELISGAVTHYQAQARLGLEDTPPLARQADMSRRLLASISGYGPLGSLLEDPQIEEIFIEGADLYAVDSSGRLQSLGVATSEAELLHQVNKLLMSSGRELSERQPIIQARVFGGRIRLGVVGRPVADQLSVTLRKYTMRHETFDRLVDLDAITPGGATLMSAAMRSGMGILICGRPGAGKTTFINASLRSVPAGHRVLCCEEVRELSAPLNHGAYYQTRPSTADGGESAAVTLRDLVKICLGMRPDLLVIGEVRGAEAFELLRAGNAGCGVMATVHSNGAREGLTALVDTAIMAGQNVPAHHVRSTLGQIFDLVLFLDREDVHFRSSSDGPIRRQVMEIAAVPALQAGDDDFAIRPLLVRPKIGGPLQWTGEAVPEQLEGALEAALAQEGTDLQSILQSHPALARGQVTKLGTNRRPVKVVSP